MLSYDNFVQIYVMETLPAALVTSITVKQLAVARKKALKRKAKDN